MGVAAVAIALRPYIQTVVHGDGLHILSLCVPASEEYQVCLLISRIHSQTAHSLTHCRASATILDARKHTQQQKPRTLTTTHDHSRPHQRNLPAKPHRTPSIRLRSYVVCSKITTRGTPPVQATLSNSSLRCQHCPLSEMDPLARGSRSRCAMMLCGAARSLSSGVTQIRYSWMRPRLCRR